MPVRAVQSNRSGWSHLCTEPDVMRKERQTGPLSHEAAAVHRAQANICLDLAARSREFWVTACLIELAQELLNRVNRDR
jgi:hypothetical protein